MVRNPQLGPTPYVARVQMHQVIGLSSQMVEGARTPFSLSTQLPARRLDLRVGRMGLPDVFDLNLVGSDSHLQFMNWTVDNNGAWDYAADTRGYTYAAVAEYDDRSWSARAAVALMPTVANGIDLNGTSIARAARTSNSSTANRRWRVCSRTSANPTATAPLRLLSFVNYGNMGVYRTPESTRPG